MDRIFHYITDVIFYAFSDNEYAKIHAKRNAAIQIVIATAAFILMMRVFPAQVVQKHDFSRQKGYKITDDISDSVFTGSDKKLQTVCFSGGHIYRMRLYMQCVVNDGEEYCENILFRLYDAEFSCIYEYSAENNKIRRVAREGYLTITPDMDLQPGVPYYYEIIVSGDCKNEYRLPTAGKEALGQAENGALYIDGLVNYDVCLVADFEYTSRLSKLDIIARYVMLGAAAAFAYILAMTAMRLYDGRLSHYDARIKKYVRIGAAALSILVSAALIVFTAVLNVFGGELWDRLFFAAGIIVMEAWILGALWRMTRILRTKKCSVISPGARIGLMWRNYIQTVCFGLLFYALCQYVNADREFYQYTNTRWMLIFFAIALLMNYSEKQLVGKFGAAWLVLSAAGSVLYCSGRFNPDIAAGMINGRAAKAWEDVVGLARLNCGVVASWGLLVITIVADRVRGEGFDMDAIVRRLMSERLRAVYAGLWVLFSALMYVYRFEKVWVFTATLPFFAILFTKSKASSGARLLRNFCNGILLSFALVTLYCLMHRPHHYWMLNRYAGIFHTVACTGMYLAVVFGAAFAKLGGKLKGRRRMIAYCYAEYFATACVAGFIMLTMSKTSFLATFVIIIAVEALTGIVYKKKVRRIASELASFAAVCIVTFPMVFTAVRTIPALVNSPVRYEIEFQDRNFMIYEGDPIDSPKYMTVRHFFDTLFGRFYTGTPEPEEEAAIQALETGLLAYTGDGLAGFELRLVREDAENGGGEGIDISNGRFQIFVDYIKASRLWGHPGMGPEEKNGKEYSHAHNSYLQIMYNFGIIAGVAFLLLCALALWRSVVLYREYGKKYSVFLAPFALIIAFGFVSLTEWAFHPCIPAGFGFLFMCSFLLRTYKY